jgi:hypothetical protein
MQKIDHNIILRKIAIFSMKIVIITSTPGRFSNKPEMCFRLPRNDHDIVLHQDGSWDPFIPKKEGPTSGKKNSPALIKGQFY